LNFDFCFDVNHPTQELFFGKNNDLFVFLCIFGFK